MTKRKTQVKDREPSPNQKKAFGLLTDNLRKNPNKKVKMGEILLKSGYSLETSKKPVNVTRSKGWQKLLATRLSEDSLTKKHHQLLEASNTFDNFIFSNSLNDAEIKKIIESVPGCKFIRTKRNASNAHAYFYRPDNGTQLKALEMAYRLHKKLGADNPNDGNQTSEVLEAVVLRVRKLLPE